MVAVLGVTLLGGVAQAGSPAAPESAVPAPAAPSPASELPLVLSIRALSLGQTALPDASSEVERVKAPTGAGSSRWPTNEVAKGVYISVMPACIPGVDEPLGPATRRNAPARRR